MGAKCLTMDNLRGIVTGHVNCCVDCLQDIWPYHVLLSEKLYPSSVPLQQRTMSSHFRQLDFSHIHQCLDLVFRALEIFDAEGVNRNYFDSGLVADFKDLRLH